MADQRLIDVAQAVSGLSRVGGRLWPIVNSPQGLIDTTAPVARSVAYQDTVNPSDR